MQAWLAPRSPEPDETVFEVWPENWPALELFLALETQWRYCPVSGAPLGIPFSEVKAAADLMGRPCTPELFADFRVMVGAVVNGA